MRSCWPVQSMAGYGHLAQDFLAIKENDALRLRVVLTDKLRNEDGQIEQFLCPLGQLVLYRWNAYLAPNPEYTVTKLVKIKLGN